MAYEITADDILHAIESIRALAPETEATFTDEEQAALIYGMPAEALFRPVNYRWQGEEGYAKFLEKLDRRGQK